MNIYTAMDSCSTQLLQDLHECISAFLRHRWYEAWALCLATNEIPNLGRDHRVTCIDRLYFNEDGTIKNVKMTLEGARRKLKRK
jgi:hypothetical protein